MRAISQISQVVHERSNLLTVHSLTSVPLSEPHFDSQARVKPLFKYCRVRGRATLVAVMVRINNFWPKACDGIGRLADGHGEGLVHTEERYVYIRELA